MDKGDDNSSNIILFMNSSDYLYFFAKIIKKFGSNIKSSYFCINKSCGKKNSMLA